MKKLSVVLATRNEEENIERCLKAIAGIADEIIVFDEYSTDKTVQIAKHYGAKVYSEPHHDNFHITKQKAIDKASGEWILQLDADEVVSPELAQEIKDTLKLSDEQILQRKTKDVKKLQLFDRHMRKISQREGSLGKKTGKVAAFFLPRRNMFLGKPLIHAGVYPDAVIRLIKRGQAYLPAVDVHEQMVVGGEVAWLFNDLLHFDSPTLRRYLWRMNRYTNLHAQQLKDKHISKNFVQFFNYTALKPFFTFIKLYIRHKGFMDGIRGFLWAMFSSMHFPLAYYKYITS